VSLTADERRRLDELAAELALENPELARALTGHAPRRRWRSPFSHLGRGGTCLPTFRGWSALILTGLAAPLLIVAVVLELPALIGLGAFVLVAGPGLVAEEQIRHRRRRGERDS